MSRRWLTLPWLTKSLSSSSWIWSSSLSIQSMSMTIHGLVDLNLSPSCSRLTTLLHLRLGSILMMMTAMVNDGLRSVHGMQEQLGFHCWKAHWSLLSILQFHVPLRQWLPVILTLTSQGRRQSWLLLPHWTEACPFGSDVVVARRHLFFWLVIIFFTGWLRCLWEKIQANADQILGKKDMNDVTEALCLSLSLLCFY